MKGKLILIIGPSAVGKTDLVHALVKSIPNSTKLMTVTTRTPRKGEVNGTDYLFITKKEFEEKIREGEFLEYAEVYGNFYGSSKKVIDEMLLRNRYVFVVIDIQGAQNIKTQRADSFAIFIKPGSIKDLKKRLCETRKDIDPLELAKRIEKAEHEVSIANKFDAVVENIDGKFEKTVKETTQILSTLP